MLKQYKHFKISLQLYSIFIFLQICTMKIYHFHVEKYLNVIIVIVLQIL